MSFIIEDNGFARDAKDIRTTRLSLLSANIDDYAVEIDLETALKTWADGAYTAWESALVEQSVEIGEKNEAFQESQEADAELLEKYNILKDLLFARYGEEDDLLDVYGVRGVSPNTHSQITQKAYDLIHGNVKRRAATDPKALPESLETALKTLADSAKTKYDSAIAEKYDAKDSTLTMQGLFDADAQRLRAVYNFACFVWGKQNIKLELLGFVPFVPKGGGQPAAPANLHYYSNTKTYSWDSVVNATSYQLAYCQFGSSDWQEAYSGEDTSVVFDPGAGNWNFRVRARNVNGYGDWSGIINVNISGSIPGTPELSYSPDGFSWDEVPSATDYQLVYRSTSETEWLELYAGPYPAGSIAFVPGEGEWVARLRAGNSFGYGNWSEERTVFIGLRAPQNVAVVFTGAPDNFLRVSWSPVTGADFVEVWNCIVALGQPAGTYAKVGQLPSSPFQQVATLGMRYYYYLIAKNAEYTSPQSSTVFFDVPV